MDTSLLSAALSTTPFSEFTSSPRPRLAASSTPESSHAGAADNVEKASESEREKDVDEVEKLSRFALQREMGVEMGCHHPYLGLGLFTGADDTTPPRGQHLHTCPPGPPSSVFRPRADSKIKHTHTLQGILFILQASTRQARADPEATQKRFFRTLAPLIVFLYLLVAGALLPLYIKRHSPRSMSFPVSTEDASSSVILQPFHGIHPRPHPSADVVPPHLSLSPSGPVDHPKGQAVDLLTIFFVFLVGIFSSILLLRVLIFIVARCLERFCDANLAEAFKPHGACRDVRGKGIGQAEMIFGGVV